MQNHHMATMMYIFNKTGSIGFPYDQSFLDYLIENYPNSGWYVVNV